MKGIQGCNVETLFFLTTTSKQAIGNLETSMFGRSFQTQFFPEGLYFCFQVFISNRFVMLVNFIEM